MGTTLAPPPSATRQPVPTSRRVGHALAVAVNGLMLWGAHRLLDWGWPGFLTDEFRSVLPLLSASLVAGMIVEGVFVLQDRGRVRGLGDAVTSAFGIVVSLRLWQVFPVDFAGYATDWSWAARGVLAVGAAGSAIGLAVAGARMVRGEPAPRAERSRG